MKSKTMKCIAIATWLISLSVVIGIAYVIETAEPQVDETIEWVYGEGSLEAQYKMARLVYFIYEAEQHGFTGGVALDHAMRRGALMDLWIQQAYGDDYW